SSLSNSGKADVCEGLRSGHEKCVGTGCDCIFGPDLSIRRERDGMVLGTVSRGILARGHRSDLRRDLGDVGQMEAPAITPAGSWRNHQGRSALAEFVRLEWRR